jgi:mannose-6-phosphate isomerase-like protein (cupin superfamily)
MLGSPRRDARRAAPRCSSGVVATPCFMTGALLTNSVRGSIALFAVFALVGAASLAQAQTAAATSQMAHADSMAHALLINAHDLKWMRIFPDLGEKSAEITIVHVDPITHATQLFIRVPKNSHVPMHWHTGNETHTVLEGTFVMECDGKRGALTAGGFNFVPARMHHEAWTTPSQGALLFITVDAAWDVNWVNGVPKPADLIGGQSASKM